MKRQQFINTFFLFFFLFRCNFVYSDDGGSMPAGQSNGLPVIRINTQNGALIDSKTNWTNITSFVLTDPDDPSNDISRVNIQPSLDRIRGRGNSTWVAPKKPYRIRFREDVSLFGLAARENWVLLAEWYDPTLIKNSFAFELGKRLNLPYSNTYHHVELYLNDVYYGTYVLTEHRQEDPAGEGVPGRVPIDPVEGWLVELDFHFSAEDPQFRTNNYNLPVMIKAPDFPLGNYTNSTNNFVVNNWNRLCYFMDSPDFPENRYRDMIDMESIIKFFLIQVFTQNFDFNGPGSVFFYKGKDKKIYASPLWDFDLSFGIGWNDVMTRFSANYYLINSGLFFIRPNNKIGRASCRERV